MFRYHSRTLSHYAEVSMSVVKHMLPSDVFHRRYSQFGNHCSIDLVTRAVDWSSFSILSSLDLAVVK